MASTLGMRTTISPRQWQPWTAVSPLPELISMVWPSGQWGGEKPAYQRLLSTRVNFLILPPYACRGRTVLRFSTNRYHLFIVEQALNEVLCTRLGSEGSKVWHDSYTMLMSPNDGEIAVRGCHCLGDMVVQMHAVLVRVLQWLVMRG